MRAISIIPEPKQISLSKGSFILDGKCKIAAGENCARLVNLLRKEIRTTTKLELSREKVSTAGVWLKILKGKGKVTPQVNYKFERLGKEEYILDIKENSIVIAGKQPTGVFYGIQTLLQLLEGGRKIRCCHIKDWPDIKLRGVHFDLKGSMPTFKSLIGTVKQLGRYKINMILLEYEDKFKYDKHPLISSPIALTKEETAKLIEVAEEQYIQIVPLVQCLGHAEYVLKHKEYVHLGEGNGEVQQYCPSNPQSLTLFKEFCSEVLPLHEKTKYFHIGGDETYLLGKCKKCRAKVKANGKLKLYLEHVGKVCEYLKEEGKIPILWDDMISRSCQPELVSELPKDVVIMYWDYQAKTSAKPYLRWQGERCSRRWLEKEYDKDKFGEVVSLFSSGWIEDIPQRILKTYKKYWETENFPIMVNSLPYIKFFQDKGYQVMGASEIRAGVEFQKFERRFLNIREWAKQISGCNGLGIVSTSWGRNSSLRRPALPFELSWYLMIASGEYYWSANGIDEKEFDRKFNLLFYGLKDSRVTDTLYLLDKANNNVVGICRLFLQCAFKKLKEAEHEAKKNKLSIKYMEVATKMLLHQRWAKEVFAEFETRYYQIKEDKMMKCELRPMLEELRKLEKALKGLKRQVSKVFRQTMPISEVEELIEANYALEERETKSWSSLVR